jgi:UDP-2,3-diacylglucosamine hydrolase
LTNSAQPLRQVFLSDLHLDAPDDARFATFAAVMAAEAAAGAHIYLLGDLCEVWVGDDDDGALAVALTEVLKNAAKQTQVALMHGNRDFLFGEAFAQRVGVHLLEDPFVLDGQVLLSHGDMFCLDDEAYQQARTMLRSAEWQASVLAQSLDARRQLAQGMRAQSQASNANKAANIMDVRVSEVQKVARQQKCTQILHGHTHRPGIHQDDGTIRYVLGDWEHCGWLAVRQADADPQIQLVRIPLTGRYETVAEYPAR